MRPNEKKDIKTLLYVTSVKKANTAQIRAYLHKFQISQHTKFYTTFSLYLPLSLYNGYTLTLLIVLFAIHHVMPLAKRHLGIKGVEISVYIITVLVPFLCLKG